MKKATLFIFLLFSLIILVSCNYSKGFKANPVIGLSYNYNGFRVNDVYLYDTNEDNLLKNRKIEIGKTLFISIENLTGFTVLDNKIYPACELTVTDAEGNIILHDDDIYAESSGYDSKTNNFSVNLKMESPIKAGNVYKTRALLYDKQNSENKIEITVKSEVSE